MRPPPCGHPAYFEGCPHCWHASADAGVAAAWGVSPDWPRGATIPPGRTAPQPEQPATCRHRGGELTGPERQARGLGQNRVWLHCLHEAKPLGDVVCPCRGCGPTCPKYEAGVPA